MDEIANGSLKDYVPNHYHLGYLMVNYGYENTEVISGKSNKGCRIV
jgi:hypothetical protein